MVEGDGEVWTIGEQGTTPVVFISYASQDAGVASAVVSEVERHGIKCWIAPRNVTPGALYADEIIRSINEAKVFLLVLSDNALRSPHVRKEVERASSKRRPIITLRIDAAALTTALEYFLSESQWIDFETDGTQLAFTKLVAAVQRHLKRTPAAEVNQPAGPVQPVPDRHRRSPESTVSRRRVSRRLLSAIGLAIVAIGAYVVREHLWLSKPLDRSKPSPVVVPRNTAATVAISEKSVAVLPFVDMSEKKDQEYFADGLSEEVIDHLARAPDLKVIARTSSFEFKGKNEDMRTIGQRLGVANLLEGSVRRSGNALRISVQLVRADTGFHIWSETYDRKLNDIFKIQDDIAVAVVHALKSTLIGKSTAIATETQNMEAYNLYLQGQAIYMRESTPEAYKTAVQYFRSALKADPNYALAWASLSDALAEQGENGYVPMDAVRQEVRRTAQRALELNPELAYAQVAMGRYLIVDELNLREGEPHIRRALELEPNNQWALGWAGTIAIFRAQFQDATSFLQKSIASDPVNPDRLFDLAVTYFYAGKYSDALKTYNRGLDLSPADRDRHLFPAQILLAQGDASSALAEMNREPDEKVRLGWSCRVLAYDALGRKQEADAALSYLKERHADDAYGIARVYANRGQLDEAFNWLDRAYLLRDSDILRAHADPLLKNVQSDPRFSALLRRLGLVI